MNENKYLALLHLLGFNHRNLFKIFENNQNYKEFYENIDAQNLKQYGLNDNQIDKIITFKKKYSIDFIESKCKQRNVEIFSVFDEEYPQSLKQMSNPPFLIYVRGKIPNAAKISVVGSRKFTSYGEKAIGVIIPELCKDFVIVSGGAAGCDTLAHKIAIENNGKTIAVIGTGMDLDYPVTNDKLFTSIAGEYGAVISMFPFCEPGNAYNFPLRNEIVAALSKGVIIIEAAEKSGTLITANLALDMGKDLFVIPGDIFKNSSGGCNNLIKSGSAKLVTCANDILEEYKMPTNTVFESQSLLIFDDSFEQELYEKLTFEPMSIDDFMEKFDFDISKLMFKLSMMEIKQLIKKDIYGKYCIK